MLQKQLRSQKKIPSPWYGKMFLDITVFLFPKLLETLRSEDLLTAIVKITYTVNYMHCSKINSEATLVQIVNFFFLQKNT
jgi:hypothetical protein